MNILSEEEIKEIESLELFEIGSGGYQFKKVEIFSSQQNVSGLTKNKRYIFYENT